jgi:hypothetical protein
MPHIHITIGEFDKNARSFPVTVQFPGRISTRRLTKDQARGLWRPQTPPTNDPEMPVILFQALLQGLETEWNNAQPVLLNELQSDPSGEASAIRIYLEIADAELNELPWELAAASFGSNCQIIRFSKSPVRSITQALQLPIQAVVVEARDPEDMTFPDLAFRLDEALAAIFGPHANIPSVFLDTRLTGASSEDLTAIVATRCLLCQLPIYEYAAA